MKTLMIGLAIAALAGPAPGRAAEYGAGEVKVYAFDIRSDETEADTLLRASCIWGGRIDIRFGAEYGIGTGELEPVAATLSAGKLKAQLKGVSVQSPDSELTGGTELLTSLPWDDAAFAILTQAGPVKLESTGLTAASFELGPQATAALKAFLDKCYNLSN